MTMFTAVRAPACPGGSTGQEARGPTRTSRGSDRGEGKTIATGGGQFFMSPGGQIRMSFDTQRRRGIRRRAVGRRAALRCQDPLHLDVARHSYVRYEFLPARPWSASRPGPSRAGGRPLPPARQHPMPSGARVRWRSAGSASAVSSHAASSRASENETLMRRLVRTESAQPGRTYDKLHRPTKGRVRVRLSHPMGCSLASQKTRRS